MYISAVVKVPKFWQYLQDLTIHATTEVKINPVALQEFTILPVITLFLGPTNSTPERKYNNAYVNLTILQATNFST